MLAEFEAGYLPDLRDALENRVRNTAGWRGVVSAWALVALIVLAFGGLEMATLLSPEAPGASALTGVVIPQHDPSCAMPQVPSDKIPSRCLPQPDSADQQELLYAPDW
jgi:hypothetical protein